MIIRACTHCGVLHNAELLPFPKLIENPDGSINTALAEWNGDAWVAKVSCPVCSKPILKPS